MIITATHENPFARSCRPRVSGATSVSCHTKSPAPLHDISPDRVPGCDAPSAVLLGKPAGPLVETVPQAAGRGSGEQDRPAAPAAGVSGAGRTSGAACEGSLERLPAESRPSTPSV